MRFSTIASFAVLALQASAFPGLPLSNALVPRADILEELGASDLFIRDDNNADGFNDDDGNNCLTKSRAQQVATNFKNLIANYTVSLANATLTTDFTDYSDSVNELINNGCPNGPQTLSQPTFTSRAQFESGQSGQPPIPFKQLNIWHTCHAVVIRWYSAMSPEIVTGIIVFETKPAPSGSKYKDLIKLVYSEFNSGAWLYNLGIFKPSC